MNKALKEKLLMLIPTNRTDLRPASVCKINSPNISIILLAFGSIKNPMALEVWRWVIVDPENQLVEREP